MKILKYIDIHLFTIYLLLGAGISVYSAAADFDRWNHSKHLTLVGSISFRCITSSLSFLVVSTLYTLGTCVWADGVLPFLRFIAVNWSSGFLFVVAISNLTVLLTFILTFF